MNEYLKASLHYEKHPELNIYFNNTVFNSINISKDDKTKRMMDCGYISNLTIKFWRLLQIRKLLTKRKNESDYCNFLLEVFLNQSLSCTDILATCLNHFMKMNLKSNKLAIQNKDFINILCSKIPDYSNLIIINNYHNWVRNKLYPYRNIVHHMGELSSYVEMRKDLKNVECCLVMREDEWDFIDIRQNLTKYPSHAALQIATDTINIPNYLTGSTGNSHKYIRIDVFFNEWIRKVHNLIAVYIDGLIWFQKN